MSRFFKEHLTAPHGLRGPAYHPPAPHSSRWQRVTCPDFGVSPHLSHVSPHQAALQKYRFFAHAQGARRAPWACAHRHTGRERCSQGRANRRPWGAKRCAAPSRYCHFNFQVLKRSWRGTVLRLVSYQPCSVRRRITQVGASSSRLNGGLYWVGPVLKMPKMSSIRPQTLRPSFFQPEAHARPGTPK